jgi:hypothetical protein
LAIFLYRLFGRVKALSLAIALASHVPTALAATVPTTRQTLDYFRGTTTTIAPPPLIPFTLDYNLQTLDMLLWLTITTAIVFFDIVWYRKLTDCHDTFPLFVEIGNPHSRVLIRLLALPHTPEQYEFDISAPMENIFISGFWFPQARIAWQTVLIQSNCTRVVYPIRRVLHLTYLQA